MGKALVLGAATLAFSAVSAGVAWADGAADLPAPGYAAPAAPPVYAAPQVYSTTSLRGAGPCLRSTAGGICRARGFAANSGFAANICLRAGVLGWLRVWLARLRPQVWVALNPPLARCAVRNS